jgi:hypothetical protein
MGKGTMRLKYPAAEQGKIIDLCMKPVESHFFIQVGIDDPGKIMLYQDLPIVVEGGATSIGHLDGWQRADRIAEELKKNGSYLIQGHTHPLPKGRKIPAAYAGWTIARTEELGDYRNKRLIGMPGGKKYLEWRKQKLTELKEAGYNTPEGMKIEEELFERSLEFSEAGLIERNGVLFHITNQIGDIENDTREHGGDSCNFYDMKTMYSYSDDDFPCLDYALLAKPRRDAIGKPSSKDNFEVSAMKYNPDVFGRFEKIDIIE